MPSLDEFDTGELSFRQVVRTFVRTYPFIRPVIRPMLAWLGGSLIIFLWLAITGFVSTGVMIGSALGGNPVGTFNATVLGLDPAVYVNVERLSDAARLDLRWPIVVIAMLQVSVALVGGGLLYYYRIWIFQRVNQNMRMGLIEQLQALSLRFHADSRIGDSIYRVYQDSSMVTEIIQALFVEPLMFISRYLFGVVVVAAFSPAFALLLGLTFLPMLLLGAGFSPPLRRGFQQAREANSSLTSWIQESVAGIRVLKACGVEGDRRDVFEARSVAAFDAAFDARTRLALFGVLAFVAVSVAMVAMQIGFAILASAAAPVWGETVLLGFGFAVWNLGTFTVARDRGFDGAWALESVVNIWARAQDMAVGLRRVFAVLDLTPEVTDRPDATPLDPVVGEVAFTGVRFGYDPQQPVIEEVSFMGHPGTITALVGPTGAGKSTLMLLLLRLMDPDAGRITIDGIDIRTVTLESLRAQIGIATQENVLFSTSVRENIRYAVPDADDAEVRAAARIACADEFIERLAEGYDTLLGERAVKLSSGQRQRLVIARALMKDAPILILDEPTAALDAETELAVFDNLKRWGASKCVFLITHRLSTIRQADQVVYLRNGRVVEAGAPEELLARSGGLFRGFVGAQSGVRAESSGTAQ